jgi:hypothetical protein
LEIEVDAKYIKGMLSKPDLQPSAAMNRWLAGIMLYDFKLIHVPGKEHSAPDALSRREPLQHEMEEAEDDDWVDDISLVIRNKARSDTRKHMISLTVKTLSKYEKEMQQLRWTYEFLDSEELQKSSITNKKESELFWKNVTKYFVYEKKLYMWHPNGHKRVLFDTQTRKM